MPGSIEITLIIIGITSGTVSIFILLIYLIHQAWAQSKINQTTRRSAPHESENTNEEHTKKAPAASNDYMEEATPIHRVKSSMKTGSVVVAPSSERNSLSTREALQPLYVESIRRERETQTLRRETLSDADLMANWKRQAREQMEVNDLSTVTDLSTNRGDASFGEPSSTIGREFDFFVRMNCCVQSTLSEFSARQPAAN